MEKNKGGRPRHGDAVKSSPLSMRVEPNLRIMLQESADANGRSLTQEVEARLGASFGRRELQLLDEDVDERLQQAMMANDTNLGEELNARLRRSFDKTLIAIPPHVVEELRAAGAKRGLSPDDEATERLQHSFLEVGFFGSAETPRLLRALGATIDRIEGNTGAKWHEDRQTWFAVREAASIIITSNAPAQVAPMISTEERALEAQQDEIRAEFAGMMEKHRRFKDAHPDGQDMDRDQLREELQLMRSLTELQLQYQEVEDKLMELRTPRVERNREARDRGWNAAEDALVDIQVTPHQRKLPRSDQWEIFKQKGTGSHGTQI